jgi:hypothetical protein
VSARVPQELYDRITSTARASQRTMAEEIFWRVRRSYEDEAAQADARAILAKANETAAQVTKQSLQAAMRQAGYTQVRGINGAAWFEPGVASIQWIADSLGEELLARAEARGIKLALEGEQSWARAAKAALEKAAFEEGEQS